MTESMTPRTPLGIYSRTSFGYAELEQDTRELQNLKHSSGSTQPTSFGNKTRAIIPEKCKNIRILAMLQLWLSVTKYLYLN